MTAGTVTVARERRVVDWRRVANRHGWTIGVYLITLGMALYWQSVVTHFGSFDVQSLALDILPLGFAAMAQAVVVISGGIDLSVGSLMSLASVVSGRYMVHMSYRDAILFALAIVVGSALAGTITGILIVASRVPDIVVTLAMLFVWQGVALKILSTPGGGAPQHFIRLAQGYTLSQWVPSGIVILLAAFAVVWLPLRRTRVGLEVYAVGSNRSAAYLSGINVARARVQAYALGGAFAALGGISLTTIATQGNPIGGTNYTLQSVAAIVLGGVALVGGKGGLIGPLGAAAVLSLLKNILQIKGFDQNYVQVIQGTIIVLIVVLGALATFQSRRRA